MCIYPYPPENIKSEINTGPSVSKRVFYPSHVMALFRTRPAATEGIFSHSFFTLSHLCSHAPKEGNRVRKKNTLENI